MQFTITGDKLDVNIRYEGFDREDYLKLQRAAAHMVQALNSTRFEVFCKNYNWAKKYYTGTLWWRKTRYAKGNSFRYTELPNSDVYDRIINGAEKLNAEQDQEADIFIKLDKRHTRNVIGYTYPSTNWQWIYNKYFTGMSVEGVAGNVAHEWCHKLGFGHEYNYNPIREFTVPYAIGNFVKNFKSE